MLHVHMTNNKLHAPFPWAGGKSKQIRQIRSFFPTDFAKKQYVEPFVGAGTVLVDRLVAWQGRGITFIAADINDGLINFWACLQSSPSSITKILKKVEYQSCADSSEIKRRRAFMMIRAKYNRTSLRREQKQPLHALHAKHRKLDYIFAAQFLYLVKCCYHGVWQINASTGEVNATPGRMTRVLDENLLHNLGVLLRSENVHFQLSDCFATIRRAKPGDIIYSDGPYDMAKKGNLYVKGGQPASFQQELAVSLNKSRSLGVKVIVSNYNTVLIRRLFPTKLWKRRMVKGNRRMNKMVTIQEVLLQSKQSMHKQ